MVFRNCRLLAFDISWHLVCQRRNIALFCISSAKLLQTIKSGHRKGLVYRSKFYFASMLSVPCQLAYQFVEQNVQKLSAQGIHFLFPTLSRLIRGNIDSINKYKVKSVIFHLGSKICMLIQGQKNFRKIEGTIPCIFKICHTQTYRENSNLFQ